MFATVLLLVFFAGRVAFGDAGGSTFDDLRIAVTQILIAVYSATAYVYLLMTARKTTADLSSVAGHLPNWETAADRAGKHRGWVLILVGAASFLVVGVAVTNATTPAPVNPWDWQNWGYDVAWHRVTTVFFVWWIGCFCYVTVVESARLTRLSESIDSIDLLDMRPFQPLTRQGLTNALLVIGAVSSLSLLAVESRYWPVLIGFWLAFILLALTGMLLPLRGIRKKVRVARDQELDWCRRSLKTARDALKSGTGEHRSIAEVTAYEAKIEGIKNWPFDHLTTTRFALYLLIPLGSWLGGAFVERGLDLILS